MLRFIIWRQFISPLTVPVQREPSCRIKVNILIETVKGWIEAE